MKKFLSLLLALIMVLSLAACGSKETPSTDDTPNDNQQTETTKGLTTESAPRSSLPSAPARPPAFTSPSAAPLPPR